MKYQEPTTLLLHQQEVKLLSQMLADSYNSGNMTPHQAALGIKVEKALQGEVAELYDELAAYREVLNR